MQFFCFEDNTHDGGCGKGGGAGRGENIKGAWHDTRAG